MYLIDRAGNKNVTKKNEMQGEDMSSDHCNTNIALHRSHPSVNFAGLG